MMKLIVVASVVAAISGACDNTFDGTVDSTWFGDRTNWSLGRFPHGQDGEVCIDGDAFVTYAANNEPANYADTTQGQVINLSDSVLEITEGIMNIGEQENAPVDCQYQNDSADRPGGWSDWTTCTEACGPAGVQSRSRSTVAQTGIYGGEACADLTGSQGCNLHACTCNGKAHGAEYAATGKNFCNMCRCHFGTERCDQRDCSVPSAAQLCDETTCTYGPLFTADDAFMSVTEATATYGTVASWPAHEMSTTVYHSATDANGAKFHCGHERGTTDNCKCYCSDASGSDNHIWHHAARHAHSEAQGLTAAGCECLASWVADDGNTYSGCQNTLTVPSPNETHGKQHDAWCKIDTASCPTNHRTVTAGSDWDSCESHATFKLSVPANYQNTMTFQPATTTTTTQPGPTWSQIGVGYCRTASGSSGGNMYTAPNTGVTNLADSRTNCRALCEADSTCLAIEANSWGGCEIWRELPAFGQGSTTGTCDQIHRA